MAPALLAVLLPLQTNFEHQNMNVLLLALLGQGTWCLQNRRDRTAGVLIGFASALKVFPAALIPFLAVAGFGRAAFAAVATAAGLTAMTIAIYGPIDAARELAAWWQVSSGGWPVRGQNQSLIAALDRATSAGLDGSGVNAPPDAPIAVVMYVLAAVGLIAAAVAVMPRRPRGAVLSCEVTAVIALSVLLSPVAWDHYWTLLFPAFLLVYRAGDRDLLGRHGIWAFCAAGLLTSGISPLTLGRTGFTIARGLSANTIAALVLYMAVLSLCHVLRRRDNAKRLAPSGAGRATD